MPVVLITGGTGLIGKTLTTHLTAKGYKVIILTRTPSRVSENPLISFAHWDIKTQQIDVASITKADYIIHLAGAGVMDKKWTQKYKQEIVESRTKSSDLLIKALKENKNNVIAIISASAIGWYGQDEKILIHKKGFTETDDADKNFLGETCRLWENSITPAKQLNKRLVKLRTGIVLSNNGGAFAEFKKPLQFGIAAILAGGRQIISWIHIDDLCRMYIYSLENENLSGNFNAVAPCPVSNKKLILQLAGMMRKQFYIPLHIPKFVLKLFLGKRSIEILKSATVSCEKIKISEFTFLYPSIDAALKNLTSNNKL